jgi:RNA polymerase sigma factor for flagellar operon FliA
MTITSGAVAHSPSSDSDVDALVEAHLPLAQFAVNAVASRIQLPAHVSRDDLLGAARVALVEAARRYDATLGASFSTYASTRLQGAVLDELRSSDWASRSVRAHARRIEAASDVLAAELGRPPTTSEIADRLGVNEADLRNVHTDVHRSVVGSIDVDGGAAERMAAPDSPEGALLHRERVGYLLDAISALPDRLGEVVERNFFDDESLTDIAADLGVTLSRVSQMRAQALRLLNAALSELLDGTPVEVTGGVRARNQQHAYISQVSAVSPDYRTRIERSRPLLARPLLAAG